MCAHQDLPKAKTKKVHSNKRVYPNPFSYPNHSTLLDGYAENYATVGSRKKTYCEG